MDWKSLITPLNIIIASSVLAAALIAYLIIAILGKGRFRKRLIRLLENPELMQSDYAGFFTPSRLGLRSSLIEKTALKQGIEILEICGVNHYWLEELKKRKSKKNYERVLKFNPDKGLFTCFLLALERKDLANLLIKWLQESDEFLLTRRIALSGVGEDFSGAKALELFRDNIPQIREMTGDPEWASRYFAVKILLYDENAQSVRAIWESMRDPHPLVRKTICREFKSENREKFYNELFRLYLTDPVQEVRAAAKERINQDFTDIYNINIDNLDTPEALHALEHLSAFSKADEDTALRFLENDNLELRFAAARFLEERGALNRLLEQADLGDRENLNRIESLLNKSCEVHITSFLALAPRSSNPGVYYIAVDILSRTGDLSLIEPVCVKIFALPQNTAENKDLYERALKCISVRGSDKSLLQLKDLLAKNRKNEEYSRLILKYLPERGAPFYIETLLDFLESPSYAARDSLREAFTRMPSDLYIQRMLHIIKTGRESFPHIVRIDALKILVQLKQSFCLQTILENLPILPHREARELARLLIDYDRNEFEKLTSLIFMADDAAVRASLISCLPAVDGKKFLKNIREALGDADPEVRISAIWSLVDFGESKTVSQAIAMLRDPVPRVRTEVARAIAETGSEAALKELQDILFDENEVSSVKIPAIYGLGSSEKLLSVEILCNLLGSSDKYDKETVEALSGKTGKKEINAIIEIFKDGSPVLRDKLSLVFTKMKESGESVLLELLQEDISTLKPFICQVLENTGFIESRIRQLKHRDKTVRRKAAFELSFIGTSSAFRGIVLAARDSDEEVRIAVTKALEKLNNKEGKKILKTLEEDPDRKVRKYTAWALERLESKNMK